MSTRLRRLAQLERLFPGRGLATNPAARNPVQQLKYIGPLLASRLATQYNIATLQQLLAYLRTHTRQANQTMLTTALLNPKARSCQLPAGRMRPAPCPCSYHVRDTNRMGYNAILYYALRRNVPLSRIPATHRARNAIQAYPNVPCGTQPVAARRARPRQPARRQPVRRQPVRAATLRR